MIKTSSFLWLTTTLVLAFSVPAEARPGDRYTVEFAVLPSLQGVHERFSRYSYGGYVYESKDEAVTPLDNSQFRFSLWSRSAFVVDFAKLRIGDPHSDYGYSEGRDLYEVGLGYDFGRGDRRLRPFSTALAGLVIIDDVGDAETYVGVAGGIRYFVRDWAAARLQLAMRQKVTNTKDAFRAIELAVGMGFFL